MTNRDLLNELVSDGKLHFSFDLRARGVDGITITRGVEKGEVRQVARGLYFSGLIEEPQDLQMAVMSLLAPGIVCLSSAAQYHEMTDEMPDRLWYAVDWDRIRVAKINRMPEAHQLLYWRNQALEVGIDTIRIADVDVRITSPARTVVDFLRLRKTFGEDIGPKAMLDYFRNGGGMAELNDIAVRLDVYDDLVPFLRVAEELQQGIPVRRP